MTDHETWSTKLFCIYVNILPGVTKILLKLSFQIQLYSQTKHFYCIIDWPSTTIKYGQKDWTCNQGDHNWLWNIMS